MVRSNAWQKLVFGTVVLALGACSMQTESDTAPAAADGDVGSVQLAVDFNDCPMGYNLVLGTTGDDALSGTAGNDCIDGLAGNDTIDATQGGTDFVIGGAGNDTITLGAGASEAYGEDGDDTITGGASNDKLYGGTGNDTLDGAGGKDNLYGREGDDILVGGAGADKLYGEAGDDILVGGSENDTLEGGGGNDLIEGNTAHDLLSGGPGGDALIGSGGNNTLDGGDNNDNCVNFISSSNCETNDGITYCPGGVGCGVTQQCETGGGINLCVFCHHDSECDDGDSSTNDVCEPITGCVNAPKAGAPTQLRPYNGAPTGSVHHNDNLKPTLSWEAVTGATSYEVQIDNSCTIGAMQSCTFPSPEITGSTATTSFTPATNLAVNNTAPVGRRYHWRVRACDGFGCGDWSAVHYLLVGRLPDDYNGDGYSDLAVGAPVQDNGATNEGNVFIYYGTNAGLSGTANRIDHPANKASALFGLALAPAGDVNADGYADLLIASPDEARGASKEGVVYVFYGSSSGISATPSVIIDSPTNQAGGRFGNALAGIGDTNWDGYPDIAIAAYFYDNSEANEGNVFVFHGSASGIQTTFSKQIDSPASQGGARFGASVGFGGDIDADGYADLIVGATHVDVNATDDGAAYVFFGSTTGVATTPSQSLTSPAVEADAQFGYAISGGGYFDDDVFSDVAIAALKADGGASNEGAVYAYLGTGSGFAMTPDVSIASPISEASAGFGAGLAALSDVNDDGFADLLVGAYLVDDGAADTGAAYVFYGSATGPSSTADVSLQTPGTQALARYGYSVAGVRDANGDGVADLACGAFGYDGGAADEGAVFVHHGVGGGDPAATPDTSLANPDAQATGSFGFALPNGGR